MMMTKSECPELDLLLQERRAAESSFKEARERLDAKIGISETAEYIRLDAAADVAWQLLNKARKRLHEHMLEHGCGDARSAGAGEYSDR